MWCFSSEYSGLRGLIDLLIPVGKNKEQTESYCVCKCPFIKYHIKGETEGKSVTTTLLASKQEMFYSRDMHSPYDSNWPGRMNVPQREWLIVFAHKKAACKVPGQS